MHHVVRAQLVLGVTVVAVLVVPAALGAALLVGIAALMGSPTLVAFVILLVGGITLMVASWGGAILSGFAVLLRPETRFWRALEVTTYLSFAASSVPIAAGSLPVFGFVAFMVYAWCCLSWGGYHGAPGH
jgi:hypothetical protein